MKITLELDLRKKHGGLKSLEHLWYSLKEARQTWLRYVIYMENIDEEWRKGAGTSRDHVDRAFKVYHNYACRVELLVELVGKDMAAKLMEVNPTHPVWVSLMLNK